MKLVKNLELVVDIIDLSFEGVGVCKVGGFPVFVQNALVGERVKIKLIKVLRKYAVGIVLEFLSLSTDRVEILDKKGTWVGTMPLQHISYEKQLELKYRHVCHLVRNIAKLNEAKILNILGCDSILGYRNKAQIPFGLIHGQIETGFYRKNTHTLIPIEDFMIQDKRIDEIILIVRDLMRAYRLSVYDELKHEGLLRHVIVRRGYYTSEVQVTLVVCAEFDEQFELAEKIVSLASDVVSVVLNVNAEKTNVILGNRQVVLFGEDCFKDKLLGKTFNISSRSFFQVNTKQCEVLYSKAIELAQLKPTDVVLDAYCGIGTIGICLADRVKQVYGMEIVPDAITMANENARLNGLANCEYVCGDAKNAFTLWHDVKFDVLFVDPPRKGLDRAFIELSVKTNADKIVYISCNPATLVRDLMLYEELGYRVEVIVPVDQFPMTAHVECVVLLTKG